MNAFAGLPNAAAVGQTVMTAFEKGQAVGDKMALRGALADFTANPDDRNALAEVMRRDPTMGMKLAEYQEKREYRGALADYVAGNPLLGGSPRKTPPALPQSNRTMAPDGDALAMPALAPVPLGAGAQPQPQAAAPGPDLAFLGEPQDGRDKAFLRMLQSDPIKALKIQSTLRENFIGRLEAERDFYGHAIDTVSQTADEPSWQAAMQRLAPMAEAIGADLFAHVPKTYPGPEGVKALMEKALPVKERLDYFMREANIDADNERADRNTDSVIENREERLEETKRVNTGRLTNQRRGQDVASRDRKRGQDLRGSSRQNIVTVKTPEEARALPSGTKFRTPEGKVKVRP